MFPSIVARQLQEGILEYFRTTFPISNSVFEGCFESLKTDSGLMYHEPFVSVKLPFRGSEPKKHFEAFEPENPPYFHQVRAFQRLTGENVRSTIIATGTGSGKTECFLYPILEHCWQHRFEKGIKAVLVYPMNALANDQSKRLAQFIHDSEKLRGNITVGMYTGSRAKSTTCMTADQVITDRETLRKYPPSILITNYKMLDYLLNRPKDAPLWRENGPETLKYLAVDELHTFDGAQGTDLACLLRRLKARLNMQPAQLCCVGTSATMGSREQEAEIRDFAGQIFGEEFDEGSIITEDRLCAEEFFSDASSRNVTLPNAEQVRELWQNIHDDDETAYIQNAVAGWFPDFSEDPMSLPGRLALAVELRDHVFVQDLISRMETGWHQNRALAEWLRLEKKYELGDAEQQKGTLDSIFALISWARTGSEENPRPFLQLHVQLWMSEMRRLLAKVGRKDLRFKTYFAMDKENLKPGKKYHDSDRENFLPVVNCRDCGATGWVSALNERKNMTIFDHRAFYNMYFSGDHRITMMFPEENPLEIIPGEDETDGPKLFYRQRLCPKCLHIQDAEYSQKTICDECDTETVPVLVPVEMHTEGNRHAHQYICPYCGSKRGLALIGLRSTTEISTCLSQVFASRFNDDKKLLAFSDNVQDAAHRAGFFSHNTWRFPLRRAILKYLQEEGAGQSLASVQDGFCRYWRERLSREEFAGYFTPPNMTWRQIYEDMVRNGNLPHDKNTEEFLQDIEKRLRYELMLEFGLRANIGRTLDKSGCATLAFSNEDIETAAERLQTRVENELNALHGIGTDLFRQMVVVFLYTLCRSGAFFDSVFHSFVKAEGKTYLLSSDVRLGRMWLPPLQSGRNTPRFLAVSHAGRKVPGFDSVLDRKYSGRLRQLVGPFLLSDDDIFHSIARILTEELAALEVLLPFADTPGMSVYGLNREKVHVSSDVKFVKCTSCRTLHSIPGEQAVLWSKLPCLRRPCSGILKPVLQGGLDYYGRLFSSGDFARVNANEHTSMLRDEDRDRIEKTFRSKVSNPWDPNVLSCTPTLEMGIDIGNLSSVVLCNMPPSEAQFVQRVGRAGRRDGNALTLVTASNTKHHDVFYYQDPHEMLDCSVLPPRIFLNASAVLERQYLAYCLDCWNKHGNLGEHAVPDTLASVFMTIGNRNTSQFPYNFLEYIQKNEQELLDSFLEIFRADLDLTARESIEKFAIGGEDESPLHAKLMKCFESQIKESANIGEKIKDVRAAIAYFRNLPKDSTHDEEIAQLEREEKGLEQMKRELRRKNVYNFLSDEGLLPNYAFPEEGVVLKAILSRFEKKEEPGKKGKEDEQRLVYEYRRRAQTALSEFAPECSFYASGHKLRIDQIDIHNAQRNTWRLCPNCAHAEAETHAHSACCPRCGDPGWGDLGQLRTMWRTPVVYSNMDYGQSSISDESDDRSNVFFLKEMLVDVDEENDIVSSYSMENGDIPFGYELVRKAVMREINFGERDMFGSKFTVAGSEEVRKGFRVCQYCGKIQPKNGKETHSRYCKTRYIPETRSDAIVSSLFIYREFETEALRILIPSTTLDSSRARTESFAAALLLGLKLHFGNVDHIRPVLCDVPTSDPICRRQYLVLYDAVPGGTGYLKELAESSQTERPALLEVFRKALEVLEHCECRNDPKAEACYHCLYRYVQTEHLGSASRKTAAKMLRSIVNGWKGLRKCEGVRTIPIDSLMESELERRFIETFPGMCTANRTLELHEALVNGKMGYRLHIQCEGRSIVWDVEPQVTLGREDGVSVTSRPDFIFWPIPRNSRRPVAVFTDGFRYHQDKLHDDTLKREAIRKSGRFRVWSFSWNDITFGLEVNEDYHTETLVPERMPSGSKCYRQMIGTGPAGQLYPDRVSAMELFVRYLSLEDAEALFTHQAHAYAYSLLDVRISQSVEKMEECRKVLERIREWTQISEGSIPTSEMFFGKWTPRYELPHLTIWSAMAKEDRKDPSKIRVHAVLEDTLENRTSNLEAEWNGMLHFANMMQFLPCFTCVTETGLRLNVYEAILAENTVEPPVSDSGWMEVIACLFDENAKLFARRAMESGVPVPDEIGSEVFGDDQSVFGEAEMVWSNAETAYLTLDQTEVRELLEKRGWRILETDSELKPEWFADK